MKKAKLLELLKYYLLILLGNLLYSFGIMVFIESKGLVTGGITGLSLWLHYNFNWNLSIVILCFNILFFFIGWIFLGRTFALNTLASSLIYPLCVAFFELFDLSFFNLTDIWLNVICGGLIIGIGLGIIMKSGASTGGIDILALLVCKKVKALSVGTALMFLDVLVMIIQIPTAGLEKFIFGIVLAVAYSFAIDKVMLFGNNKVELLIVSNKQEEVRNLIISEFDRTVTFLHSKTGYLNHEIDTILTIIDIRELNKLKDRIYSLDSGAFIVVNKVTEVSGRGFSTAKVYKDINLEEVNKEAEQSS